MIKVRAQQMTIETPLEGADPWIRVIVQRVEKNGDIVNTVDRWDSFNKRLSEVALQEVPFPHSASNVFTIYEISQQIIATVCVWLMERYGGTMDAQGNVIIEA